MEADFDITYEKENGTLLSQTVDRVVEDLEILTKSDPHELPKYINRKWMTGAIAQSYKERLSKVCLERSRKGHEVVSGGNGVICSRPR